MVLGGVDPVDPGPADVGVDRAVGAEHDHRGAAFPGAEDRHRGVQQADIGVDGDGHRLVGDPGVAVGDGDGMFLVQANQHLRVVVAEIVDDGIVEAAIAGAGHQGHVLEVTLARHLGDGVGDPAHARVAELDRAVDGGGGVGGFRFGGGRAPAGGFRHCFSPLNLFGNGIGIKKYRIIAAAPGAASPAITGRKENPSRLNSPPRGAITRRCLAYNLMVSRVTLSPSSNSTVLVSKLACSTRML